MKGRIFLEFKNLAAFIFFKEITRVLRNGGRYVCISLLQEHIIRKLLSYFPGAGFMFRVIRCHEAELKTREEDGNAMPVFVVVATKFKSLTQSVRINFNFYLSSFRW